MKFINTMILQINNREYSIIIWFTLFLSLIFLKKDIRSSFFEVLKAFFIPKLFIPFLVLSTYVILIILFFYKNGLWKIYLFKDTLVWYSGVAFIYYININKAIEEDGFFKKVLIDNLKLIVIIQFVVNMCVYSLTIELLIIPIVTFLFVMHVFSGGKEKDQILHRILSWLLSVIGCTFIIFSFSKVFFDFNNFFSSVTFHKIVLPIFLSISLIPFLYLLALAILYETVFMRLSIKEYYKNNLKYIKLMVVRKCNVNLNRLKRFQRIMFEFDLSTKEGVSLAMDKIKKSGKYP